MSRNFAPPCPLHGDSADLLDDAVIYGRSFGKIWKCRIAGCDYRVGTHPDDRPKGTMANEAMRQARRRAHVAFDAWWRSHGLRRGDAYRELRNKTGVAHIAEATIEECLLVEQTFR